MYRYLTLSFLNCKIVVGKGCGANAAAADVRDSQVQKISMKKVRRPFYKACIIKVTMLFFFSYMRNMALLQTFEELPYKEPTSPDVITPHAHTHTVVLSPASMQT